MWLPNDLFYAFPEAFYLMFLLLALGLLLYGLFDFRQKTLRKYFHPDTLRKILVPRSSVNFTFKALGICCVWAFVVMALMQPKGNGRYPLEQALEASEKPSGKSAEVTVKRKAHDVIFLVDASASMGVKDTRTGQSRLDFAKEIVDEIISRLKGESAALYAFTSDTTRLSPPTMDYLFVRLVLKDMDINEGEIAGTSLIEALSDVREAYFLKPTAQLKTVVLLTDGGDTSIEGLEGEARKKQTEMLLEFLKDAGRNQLRVFTIGMGTAQGSPVPGIKHEGQQVVSSLDEKLLQAISEKGRSSYYFANEWPPLDLATDVIGKMGEDDPVLEEFKIKRSEGLVRGGDDLVYDHFFQIPLGAAILLLAWFLLFPDTRVRK